MPLSVKSDFRLFHSPFHALRDNISGIAADGKDILLALLVPILASLYPFMFFCARNLHEVAVDNFLLVFAAIILLSLLGTICLQLFIRRWEKTAVIGLSLAVSFFSYGHVRNILTGIGSPFGRQYLLFPVFIILTAILVYCEIRTRLNFRRMIGPAMIIYLALIVYSAYPVVSHLIQTAQTDAAFSQKMASQRGKSYSDYPDIYLIVVDDYPRQDALARQFKYDNSAYLDSLRQMGFQIADCSQSNYFWTNQSLYSMLNMQYITDITNPDWLVPNPVSQDDLSSGIKFSPVRQKLEQKGYITVGFETSYAFSEIRNADYFFKVKENALMLNHFTDIFLNTTMYAMVRPVKQRLGLTTALGTAAKVNLANSPEYYYSLKIGTYESLEESVSIDSPKFVFAHLLSIHRPFVMDAQGNYIGEQMPSRTSFLDQVKYNDDRMLKLLPDIISQSKIPPIIFLVSDHGYRSRPENGFSNLIAVYGPDSLKDQIYPSFTLVNLFRILFADVFDEEFSLLPDAQYYSEEMNSQTLERMEFDCGG